MAVSVSTPASGSAADATTITLSSYAVPAGSDKILTVEISIEDFTGGALAVVNSVTHDGVGLTQRKRHTSGGTTGNISEIWDLQLGSSTPSGDIVVTLDSQTDTLLASALTAIGVAQQAPEATASQNVASSPVNTAITTVTNGALIIDCVSAGTPNAVSVTQGPDQVEDINLAILSAVLAVSHRIGGSAGSHTLGWSQITSTNRLVHTLAAYKEAVAVAGIAPHMHYYKMMRAQ